jgi:hypothetical protein
VPPHPRLVASDDGGISCPTVTPVSKGSDYAEGRRRTRLVQGGVVAQQPPTAYGEEAQSDRRGRQCGAARDTVDEHMITRALE